MMASNPDRPYQPMCIPKTSNFLRPHTVTLWSVRVIHIMKMIKQTAGRTSAINTGSPPGILKGRSKFGSVIRNVTAAQKMSA